MKKILLTGAFLLASFLTAQAQLTLTVADAEGNPLTFEGAMFGLVADAGELTGTLTSVDYDVVLEDSVEETYANDLAIIVSTGLAANSDIALQVGGFSNFGATEHLEFFEGASEDPGTVLAETVTLETPLELTDTDYKVYIGNGYSNESGTNSGTWSGTITLNGLAVASVKNVLAISFAVSPNPANDVINISNGSSALIKGLQIVDLNGRTVKTANFDAISETSINVSDLASGVYMMNISSDRGTVTKKIVKN